MPKTNNRNNPALEKKGSYTRQSWINSWWLGWLKGENQPSDLKTRSVKPVTAIWLTVACASVASSKPHVDFNLHTNTFVVGDNCLIIQNYNEPGKVYSCDPKGGHRCAKTVNATICCNDPHSEHKYILIINQAIQINCLENHLLCLMMCHLKGEHINKVPNF